MKTIDTDESDKERVMMTVSRKSKGIRNVLLIAIFGRLLVDLTMHQDLLSHVSEDILLPSIGQTNINSTALIHQFSDLSTIRKWGCHRSETPLIFVHIGKSGGGSVRARFAAGAENFTRNTFFGWKDPTTDNHFYPVKTSSGTARGSYCTSLNRHYRMPKMKTFDQVGYEGVFDCHATTPIGKMVGCPSFWVEDGHCLGCGDMNSKNCHTVYTGHNYFGNEVHWLPAPYVQEWWRKHWTPLLESDGISNGLNSLNPGTTNPIWCPAQNKTRAADRKYVLGSGRAVREIHKECSQSISSKIDEIFRTLWESIPENNQAQGSNYAPIYASLPLHRTVLLREPLSWLISRFFWAHIDDHHRCDDYRFATKQNASSFTDSGWLVRFVRDHIYYLCGEECQNRFEVGAMTIEDIERQAESNLRHSFSVVGLINETKDFFDMVSNRIQYINLSNNPRVRGDRHSTMASHRNRTEIKRCQDQFFQNETFKELIREAVPQFRTLEKLYQVGVQVNRFQKEELRQCTSY